MLYARSSRCSLMIEPRYLLIGISTLSPPHMTAPRQQAMLDACVYRAYWMLAMLTQAAERTQPSHDEPAIIVAVFSYKQQSQLYIV